MKSLFLKCFILLTSAIYAQNEINWDGEYQLQLSDFQSVASEIGTAKNNTVFMSSSFDFAFAMSNIEFMFTKNFNSKVNNTFKKAAASMVAVDKESAIKMLALAQYSFDLSELYARKFRKKLHEEKRTLSNISFIKPLYEAIQKDYTAQMTTAIKETDLGLKTEKLKLLQEQLSKEITELADYCKECKVPKLKK